MRSLYVNDKGHDCFDIDVGMYDVNLKSMFQRESDFGQK
jgi:hypothetical protein